MPAVISHYQLALRVFSRMEKAGVPVAHREAALIGAQGPDIFFFHRILPWQYGVSYTAQGTQLHKLHPALLFRALRAELRSVNGEQREVLLGYIQGLFCHYALDRTVHPFVYARQEMLAQQEPAYAAAAHSYHFRIESALDTILLRRETGRLVRDFSLPRVLPLDQNGLYTAVGEIYAPLFAALLHTSAHPAHIGKAVGDMRFVLGLMNDHTCLLRAYLLRPLEIASGQGHFASCLLRPWETKEWDYVNAAHHVWRNPACAAETSTQDFFELYDAAITQAVQMITAFMEGAPILPITGNREFSGAPCDNALTF